MIGLIDFFIRRYVFSISVFTAIVLFGVVAATRVGVDLLPNFELSFVTVTTTYPGAGSEEVAKQIAEPIEGALATLPGINSLSSTSFEGFAVVVVEFTADVDANQAAVDVSQRVNAILGTLPDDASSPSIQKLDPNDEPILNVALVAQGEDLRTVQAYAEDVLEPDLQRVGGVADVSVVGPVNREVQVLLDPNALQLYSLTPNQVAGAIQGASSDLPLGNLTVNGERLLFAGRSSLTSPADIERVVVDSGRGLRVGDVGAVRDASADITAYSRLNGQPVVLLEVLKQSGANSVSTAGGVRQALKNLELPAGYQAYVVNDTTPFITSTVNDTLGELVRAVLVVSIIVLMFIGRLGSVFSVIMAIPISFAGALILFGLFGFTFNIVTLLAITVAVGLVVDDSIVVAEAIDRYREAGYSKLEAVRLGAGEVSVAVLASTLSLLAVFLPISFLPGIIGQFFSEFGLTLTATIIASYLEALFFLTVRLAYFGDPLPPTWREASGSFGKLGADARFMVTKAWRRWWFWLLYLGLAGGAVAGILTDRLNLPSFGLPTPVLAGMAAAAVLLLLPLVLIPIVYVTRLALALSGAVGRTLYEVTDRFTAWLRGAYGRALGAALNHATMVLVAAGLLFGSVFFIAPRLGFNFTPATDSGQAGITLKLPTGTALATTNELAGRVEDALLGRPEIATLQTSVGVNSGDVGNSAASERAEFVIELVPKSERAKSDRGYALEYDVIVKEILADRPEAEVSASALQNAGPPSTSDYSITLASSDLDLLAERDALARRTLADNPYLNNVASGLDTTVSERVFDLDDTRLVGTGLSVADVYATLRAYNVGIEAARLSEGGKEYPIQVRVNPTALRDESALLSLPVSSPLLGTSLPLGELGRFSAALAPTSINRTDQTYTSTVTASVLPGAPPTSQLKSLLKNDLQTAGVFDERVTEGQSTGLDLTGDLVLYTPIAFALALLLNYFVIASQFNSFKFPLYLLLTVPLALVGALWLFFLTGTALDINSVLGVVILTGLVTKNAILLLDLVVNQEQTEAGETLKERLVRAGTVRLRPILMTTLTLIAISVPLLLGSGDGSEFRKPLGMIIFGGVTVSALLTLFVIPAAFYRFERKNYDDEREADAPATAEPFPAMPSAASD